MTAISCAEMERIVREEVPAVGRYGVRFEAMGDGTARAVLPFQADVLRPGGTISGPVMMGLADVVAYACVLSRIGIVKLAVTTGFNANFLRRPEPADLIAEGRLLKCGRRLAVAEVSLFSPGAGEDAVCHATATYSIPPTAPVPAGK